MAAAGRFRGMSGLSLEQRQRQTIVEVSRLLGAAAVDHWLFGGWAVDYHMGTPTRPHSDIDYVARFADRGRIAKLLTDAGFEPRSTDELGAVQAFDRDGVVVELTYIAAGPTGSTITPGYEEWPWEQGSFGSDQGVLDDHAVPLVSIAGLIAVKRGWKAHFGEAPRSGDLADLELLSSLGGEPDRGNPRHQSL